MKNNSCIIQYKRWASQRENNNDNNDNNNVFSKRNEAISIYTIMALYPTKKNYINLY